MSSPASSNPKLSSDSERTDLDLDDLNDLNLVTYQRYWEAIYHKTIREVQQIKEGEKLALRRDHPSTTSAPKN